MGCLYYCPLLSPRGLALCLCAHILLSLLSLAFPCQDSKVRIIFMPHNLISFSFLWCNLEPGLQASVLNICSRMKNNRFPFLLVKNDWILEVPTFEKIGFWEIEKITLHIQSVIFKTTIFLRSFQKSQFGSTWVAQLVKHLTLVQVVISQLVSSSHVLTAQSLESASCWFCVSLSLPLFCSCSVCVSLRNRLFFF